MQMSAHVNGAIARAASADGGSGAAPLASRELAKLFGVFAHPDRIRLVEELGGGERDVRSLELALGVSHSRVSQHLALLRTFRLVTERRQGRHVFYRLAAPELARWIARGLDFVGADLAEAHAIRDAALATRNAWLPSRKGGRR